MTRTPLIPAELALVNRALADLIDLAALELIVSLCMDCARVCGVKFADGQPGISHGLCDACHSTREGMDIAH